MPYLWKIHGAKLQIYNYPRCNELLAKYKESVIFIIIILFFFFQRFIRPVEALTRVLFNQKNGTSRNRFSFIRENKKKR